MEYEDELVKLNRRVTDLENQASNRFKVSPLPANAGLEDIINKLNEIISKINTKLR